MSFSNTGLFAPLLSSFPMNEYKIILKISLIVLEFLFSGKCAYTLPFYC